MRRPMSVRHHVALVLLNIARGLETGKPTSIRKQKRIADCLFFSYRLLMKK
jgi:hypothetical protein